MRAYDANILFLGPRMDVVPELSCPLFLWLQNFEISELSHTIQRLERKVNAMVLRLAFLAQNLLRQHSRTSQKNSMWTPPFRKTAIQRQAATKVRFFHTNPGQVVDGRSA